MDRTKAGKEIAELFIRAVQKYNALEKIPVKVGTKHDLYHSEKHFLDVIGDNPGMNMTEFAGSIGVTKGAVSQFVVKLEAKGLVQRYKSGDNGKEVFLELTRAGRELYIQHKKKNEETIKPLIKELDKYSDDKVEFFITMLGWIGDFLEQSKEQMRKKHR
jgi:DNA-binding MarR family transcriptional regulator